MVKQIEDLIRVLDQAGGALTADGDDVGEHVTVRRAKREIAITIANLTRLNWVADNDCE
ncbi:hypothetical protein [Actinokineospora sp. UTMC 2448]|uniref:hypothetical protein n=1 Tax=Actinokineospora sp. UTMC 2448 TaxID=2268449 RepID=UPI002164105C|nr:hypothetical protein [Actinokineospora sp. UTMC 2448]UVS78381.1 hypothetical protein Actkin_02114 [Actinokineospora sp. UTMC 2448]